MSLTRGSIAPLGRPTGGRLNIEVPAAPAHLLFIHAVPARIRGIVDGVTVVDTTAGQMLHETRLLPRWYLPGADVRSDLLEPSVTKTHCPFKGDARYWDLRVGETVIRDAFWEYPEPLPGALDLTGLLSPYLDRWGTWLEEDEELFGHPKDPYHRVDVLRSSRTVTIRSGDDVVARSSRARALNETGFPTRWYLPVDDIEPGALSPTTTSTVCPYKGTASYWTVRGRGTSFPDGAWSYEDPIPEVAGIRGMISFLAEGLDVEVS